MTQPRHGSPRTEVNDLRNIVDRLDLLMGGPGRGSGRRGSSPRDEALAALGERVDALEAEVDELRTLVNHLMTIATWQAKVTAALVDDRDAIGPTTARPGPERENGEPGRPAAQDRHGTGDPGPTRHRSQAPSSALDDDIDEILGAERGGARHDPAPPDFGI